jgi:hypothetical protein
MQLPGPVRAFVGLIAVTAEEARHLPDRAIELPMLAVSSALQLSLRAQQRYARLAARGDDVLNRRPPSDEAPPWATFDEPVTADELHGAGLGDPDPALGARAASQLLDELLGQSEDAAPPPAQQAPAKKSAPAKRAPAKRASSSKKPAAKKVTAAKKASGGKTINAPRHTSPSRFDTVDDS